ncbi:MAG: hypothetical protein IJY28_05915, partial [Clostridia bacterium]|nr:hypothetical protein [Clostridia bacterium]
AVGGTCDSGGIDFLFAVIKTRPPVCPEGVRLSRNCLMRYTDGQDAQMKIFLLPFSCPLRLAALGTSPGGRGLGNTIFFYYLWVMSAKL